MKLFAIADLHGALAPIDTAEDQIRESDIVIITGDITKKGTREEARQIVDYISRYNENMLCVHGNMDRKEVMEFLVEKGYSLHGRGGMISGVGFFGLGGSNKTPMRTRTEYSEEELWDFLCSGYEQIKNAETIVLISHVPPRGLRDRTFFGKRVGSTSVKKFIDENRIDICLSGHIHEASGYEYYNNTLVVNTGSFKKGRYASLDIGDTIFVKKGRLKKL